MPERNWAGNITYRGRIHRPDSLDELRRIVARAPRIRVIGSRHSFNAIVDSSELVSLRTLPSGIEIDEGAATVTCSGALSYGELSPRLHARGLALHNLASLPQVTIAGAVATATHGSGDRCGNLATAVTAVELVTSTGELVEFARGDPDFDGLVVGLGATGAVTRLTLALEPGYELRQDVYEGLAWRALAERFDEIMAAGRSVSVFTRWGETAGQLWVKRWPDRSAPATPRTLFGARAADRQRHPITGADPAACTPQLGVAGPWHERLPHFRIDHTPSAGDELQCEYLLPRADATAAFAALRDLGPTLAPLLLVSEIRTVAADRLWMSPQYERDTVAVHFTWRRDPERVLPLIEAIEDALAPFAPRPHWGKLFAVRAADLAPRYPRLPDFAKLLERLDPRGAFRNEWLDTHVLSGPAVPH